MKILITGGTGFIGNHLCRKLLNDGNQIICLDNNSTGSINNIKDMLKNPNFQFNFMVADLHSLTSLKDARELRENIINTAACYAACGIDFTADNISIFQQSKISEHAQLAWIFQTITPMGIFGCGRSCR